MSHTLLVRPLKAKERSHCSLFQAETRLDTLEDR